MGSIYLRDQIGCEVFDYQALMNALKQYRAPRQKVNELLKAGEIIRVKKGLYVFGTRASRGTFSKLSLANTIYGPSYVSFESALSFYKLIPERVEVVSSVTCKKNKEHLTPVGVFTYRYLNIKKYPLGVVLKEIEPGVSLFMASPEKALVDHMTLTIGPQKRGSLGNMLADLRIDEDELVKILDTACIREIAKHYTNPGVAELLEYSTAMENRHG